MPIDIVLVLSILGIGVVLLVTEVIPMEVTALLTLGAVTVSGLIRPVDALAGFSNPAVVTVWAVFILSGGLTLTGVADIIGRAVRRIAGRNEIVMIVVIMVSAGLMSAVMNNVAVAALMLPVVVGLAQQTGTPPSRLLLPLAYGSLLGGLSTQIGTPPNILVTDALRDNGFAPFSFFDFTPIGLVILTVGVAYMALVGRHLLPRRDVIRETSDRSTDWRSEYALEERLFNVSVPDQSPLVGATLAASRLRSALGVNVIGITRKDHTLLNPGPAEVLAAGDRLTVEGRVDSVLEFRNWTELSVEPGPVGAGLLASGPVALAEFEIVERSDLIGETLVTLDFYNRFDAMVLGLHRDGRLLASDMHHAPIAPDDRLVVMGRHAALERLRERIGSAHFRDLEPAELLQRYRLQDELRAMRVPDTSPLVGRTLRDSRLGQTMNIRVLAVARPDGTSVLPAPDEMLQANDRLIVACRKEDLRLIKGLRELRVERRGQPKLETLGNGNAGIVEAVLSPHTALAGTSLRRLNFREKFGLNVLAVWREGKPIYRDLADLRLNFGDALLVFGTRKRLRLLNREPDFIVLRDAVQEVPHPKKAGISILIMAGVLVPVVLGWLPIYISAVIGAAVMVLTGCLTMDEAYRQIEWKAVFLIAGLLPLGTALDQTGAARMIAEQVVGMVGPFGPTAVMAGLVALTFLATCFIPTAALVVLMAPIVFNTAANMGLSPYGLLMAVAMAASASFTTPISHPANILVMGPGGYRFTDYLKVGGSLTLVIFLVILVALPVFWPLSP